jgi:hypothetical protein
MAEKMVVVCDICGRPATETVTIKVARGNYVKDLCGTHVNELTAGARRPRPGRPRKLAGAADTVTPRRRGRPRKTTARKTRKTAGKKTAARRKTAGRRKAQASSGGASA